MKQIFTNKMHSALDWAKLELNLGNLNPTELEFMSCNIIDNIDLIMLGNITITPVYKNDCTQVLNSICLLF